MQQPITASQIFMSCFDAEERCSSTRPQLLKIGLIGLLVGFFVGGGEESFFVGGRECFLVGIVVEGRKVGDCGVVGFLVLVFADSPCLAQDGRFVLIFTL